MKTAPTTLAEDLKSIFSEKASLISEEGVMDAMTIYMHEQKMMPQMLTAPLHARACSEFTQQLINDELGLKLLLSIYCTPDARFAAGNFKSALVDVMDTHRLYEDMRK
jgi:hypothetical protein